ncbi:MAG: hypothetical protein Q7S41_00060 [Candidatus Limnocylindria bacterium]|nr:hypothetical protein [Candidatus Limnocylindria bacterium]
MDRHKNGPYYCDAILADSRTNAGRAAVVESSAEARGWAGSLGLRSFGSLPELVTALG